jgi:hypothetical protein
MLAQLEVKEINSKTFKDFYRFSRTFQSWNFFSNSRTFQDFQGPWTIDILYTLDSASNYSAIQKLKP